MNTSKIKFNYEYKCRNNGVLVVKGEILEVEHQQAKPTEHDIKKAFSKKIGATNLAISSSISMWEMV
jgi:hypothetical protein